MWGSEISSSPPNPHHEARLKDQTGEAPVWPSGMRMRKCISRGKQRTRVWVGKIACISLGFRPQVFIGIPLLALQVRSCALHASADITYDVTDRVWQLFWAWAGTPICVHYYLLAWPSRLTSPWVRPLLARGWHGRAIAWPRVSNMTSGERGSLARYPIYAWARPWPNLRVQRLSQAPQWAWGNDPRSSAYNHPSLALELSLKAPFVAWPVLVDRNVRPTTNSSMNKTMINLKKNWL